MQESILYSDHLIHMITQGKGVHAPDTPLSVIRSAIIKVDPHKSRADVNRYLARGTHASVEDMLIMEAQQIPINISTFIIRLRRGVLFPTAAPINKPKPT